ncbi:MAG: cytochrome c biogenesis protein DipZ [Alphaproteobacteria bacterium]
MVISNLILAFFEGVALIASPCILPVLPLVLSASVDGGRKRPLGIITGFVLAFSAFTLLSRHLLQILAIDPIIIKNMALVFLTIFAVMMLSSRLTEKFSAATQGLAVLGDKLAARHQGQGFFSGTLLGGVIGLIWTPCAGPILATILVQIITNHDNSLSLFTVMAFASGAAVPMLLIALLGRKILNTLSFFKQQSGALRKILGVVMLLTIAALISGIDFNKPLANNSGDTYQEADSQQGLIDALAAPYPAPAIEGIEAWLNSSPLQLDSLKGKVVLIDFWTYSCINCVRTLPYLTAWDKKYRNDGLVIIGIHAPEFAFEKQQQNVEAAIKKHGIDYPVALDNQFSTWKNFSNRYWPAHYLINAQGQVVYTHAGEGNYNIMEHNIQYLLGVNKAPEYQSPHQSHDQQTPETYLGYDRSAHIDPQTTIKRNQIANYSYPNLLPNHHWALQGKWLVGEDNITAMEKNAGLRLHFTAQKVFLVLGSKNNRPITVHVSLNGEKKPDITVSKHDVYLLTEQTDMINGTLEIKAEEEGLEAYAFTFG